MRKRKLLRRQFLEKLGIAYRYYSRFRQRFPSCPASSPCSVNASFLFQCVLCVPWFGKKDNKPRNTQNTRKRKHGKDRSVRRTRFVSNSPFARIEFCLQVGK